MSLNLSIETLARHEVQPVIPGLARLRIEVFYAYPYLYDGDAAYEQSYLEKLRSARDSVIVAARDGEGLIGCATGCALDDSHEEFIAPIADCGIATADTFYFGESVLLETYRGHGVGHAFFDHREAHASARGYRRTCFCAVVRPDDHPMRPADYTPLDAFWRKRGYAPMDGVIANFGWKDLGSSEVTQKPMQFWMRELD